MSIGTDPHASLLRGLHEAAEGRCERMDWITDVDPSYNGADHFAPITDLTDPEVIKDRQAEAEMA